MFVASVNTIFMTSYYRVCETGYSAFPQSVEGDSLKDRYSISELHLAARMRLAALAYDC